MHAPTEATLLPFPVHLKPYIVGGFQATRDQLRPPSVIHISSKRTRDARSAAKKTCGRGSCPRACDSSWYCKCHTARLFFTAILRRWPRLLRRSGSTPRSSIWRYWRRQWSTLRMLDHNCCGLQPRTKCCTRRRPHQGFSVFNVSRAAAAGERRRSAEWRRTDVART